MRMRAQPDSSFSKQAIFVLPRCCHGDEEQNVRRFNMQMWAQRSRTEGYYTQDKLRYYSQSATGEWIEILQEFWVGSTVMWPACLRTNLTPRLEN